MDPEREDTTQRSDMQPNKPTPTASQTAFAIPELAENVLNRLPDLRDLVHVRATSKILKTMVDQTPSIRRRLWNLPTPIKRGENPHFPNLSQTLFEYGIEGSMGSVLETFHDIEWDYYDAIEAGEDPKIALTAREDQIRYFYMGKVRPDNFWLSWFLDQPIERGFHCSRCGHLHPQFLFSGLHPELGFLQDYGMCGRRTGSELLFRFTFRYVTIDELLDASDHEQHRALSYHLAWLTRAVSEAYVAAKQHGILHHYIIAPMCTKLILAHGNSGNDMDIASYTIRDSDGIKLGQLLRALLRLCRCSLSDRRAEALKIDDAYIVEMWDETQAVVQSSLGVD